MATETIDVSVILCTYTEARWHEFVAAVDSLRHQTKVPREIIVVVDHNQDLLRRVRAELHDVVTVENSGTKGLSGARNSGIAIARGAYIAYLDDDATAEPQWLERLHECFNDATVMGVGGTVVPSWSGEQPRWFPKEFNWVIGCSYQEIPEHPIQVRNPFGGCACYRREIFDAVGGFSTEIGRIGTLPMGCEETELCIRASQHWPEKSFLYQPEARIHHHIPQARTKWQYFRKRCFAEGLSKATVAKLVGSKDGLSTERTYVTKTLLGGVLRGVSDGVLRLDASGFARAGAIAMGLAITTVGYATGTVSARLKRRKVVESEYMPEPLVV